MNLNGVDQSLIDRMNKQFSTSQNYNNALNYTQTLLDKVNSGKTSYTDNLNNLLANYQNKDKFKYDMNTDTMFQNALSSAIGQGKNAMQDTIGQASALTGGYGNSYATSVGNQTYNNYVKGAYDNLPQYYQMALDTYNAQDQRDLAQIGLVKDADATEYGRNKDAYALNKDKTDTMYNQEFNSWQTSVDQAQKSATMQNTDWWNKTNYDEQIRQYNENLAFEKQKQAENVALQKQQMAQTYALSKQKTASSSKSSGSSSKSSSYKVPTQAMFKEALSAWDTKGQAGLDKYLATIPEYDIVQLDDYVDKYGSGMWKRSTPQTNAQKLKNSFNFMKNFK